MVKYCFLKTDLHLYHLIKSQLMNLMMTMMNFQHYLEFTILGSFIDGELMDQNLAHLELYINFSLTFKNQSLHHFNRKTKPNFNQGPPHKHYFYYLVINSYLNFLLKLFNDMVLVSKINYFSN